MILVLLVGLGHPRPCPAAGAMQTVAVMPFRDLSGDNSKIGEALRETVTVDLKALSQLRVIERSEIERVVGELKLQSQRTDLDPATAARVGKLLGATLMVCGAFQRATERVRLTARFVRVETSEVVGATKVDGPVRELLRLQDKVTAELLMSAGLSVHVKRVVSRPRPVLKTLTTVELYGQALVADNDTIRLPLLRLAVSQDENFSYAVNDLRALEARLERYQAQNEAILNERFAKQREATYLLLSSKPEAAFAAVQTLLNLLFSNGYYHQLAREARMILALPTPPALPTPNAWDAAANMLMLADFRLCDWDAMLRDGEGALQRFPGSPFFSAIKAQVESAIRRKRAISEGKAKAEAEMSALRDDDRWELCQLASIYRRHEQTPEALRLYRGCLATQDPANAREGARKNLLQDMALLAARSGDFKQARVLLRDLEAEDVNLAKLTRANAELPKDGPDARPEPGPAGGP